MRLDSPLARATLGWFHERSVQGIMITDTDLIVRGWNHWLEVHSGRPAPALVGRPLLDVWPELVSRGLDQYYADALAGRVRVVAQALHGYLVPLRSRVEAFKHMPHSARIAPLMDGDRVVGTITVIDDVTERVVHEDELRSQIAALGAARSLAEEAMRAKDEFLATLSHELRTPLNSVLGWARILKSSRQDAAMVERALEVIERNAVAQVRLIDDLLDMSRITSGKLRLDLVPIDVVLPVMAAVDVVAPLAATKGIDVQVHVAHNLPVVLGDVERLQQVVWNLLSNALKFTPAGGRVDVRLEPTPAGVTLSMTDTGVGIAPDFLPHIFERFRQADPSRTRRHGGLGLGLALVHQIVALHGGTVTVESPGLGLGATFSVALPGTTHRTPPVPPPPAGIDGAAPRLAKVTMLVVDDDADAGEFLQREMEHSGARVVVARSCADAMTLLADRPSESGPIVVIADIGMPGEDGYALIRKLRDLDAQRGDSTPAVAVTAYARAEDRASLITAGFQAHLAKPVDVEALIEAVSELVAAPRAQK